MPSIAASGYIVWRGQAAVASTAAVYVPRRIWRRRGGPRRGPPMAIPEFGRAEVGGLKSASVVNLIFFVRAS